MKLKILTGNKATYWPTDRNKELDLPDFFIAKKYFSETESLDCRAPEHSLPTSSRFQYDIQIWMLLKATSPKDLLREIKNLQEGKAPGYDLSMPCF